MGQGSQPYRGQGMVSAARLGRLGLQRLSGCPQAVSVSGERAGLAPSSQQTTGRAWLVLCSITGSSAQLPEVHRQGVSSPVPRQWE